MSDLRTIRAPGATLVSEAFGTPDARPVLLIMGATLSRLGWPTRFCEDLAAAGFFVIRYDARDTGQSSHWPPGAPGYGLDDLMADALAVLDGWGIARAHVMGMSLGGYLGQLLALRRPDRVITLTCLASEPVGPGDPDAPLDPAFLAHFGRLAEVDWTDRAAAVAFGVEGARLLSRRPFDAALAARAAGAEWDNAASPASAFNHALLSGGEAGGVAGGEALPGLVPPLLVIHGSRDPLLPPARARRLAARVPGSRLMWLDGAGHELHPEDWPAIIAAVADHAASPRSAR